MAIGDVFKITVGFTDTDSGTDDSFGIHGRQTGATPVIGDIGDDVKDWWNTGTGATDAQKIHHAPSLALAEVKLRQVDPISPFEESYTTGLPIVGTGADAPLPPQTSALLSCRTVNIGKSYSGRIYLPYGIEADTGSTNVWQSAAADAFKANMLALFAKLVADGLTPVVYSPTLGVNTVISTLLVDTVVRTQRRRAKLTPSYR